MAATHLMHLYRQQLETSVAETKSTKVTLYGTLLMDAYSKQPVRERLVVTQRLQKEPAAVQVF